MAAAAATPSRPFHVAAKPAPLFLASPAHAVDWAAEARAGAAARTSALHHPLAAATRRGEAQEAAEEAAEEAVEEAAAAGARLGMVSAARGARRREGLKGATGGETPAES